MAPIKFEEDMKEKLEGRAIQPSSQAWGKLTERLDAQEKKKNHKPYWWLGIAASIIGILFVVSQFWSNETKIEITPKVVENPRIILQESNPQITNESVLIEDFIITEGVNNIEKNKKLIEIKTENILKPKRVKESVAFVLKDKEIKQDKNIKVKSVEIVKEEMSFEDRLIKHVVAKVQAIKNNNESITDADIDALLKQAQNQIRLNNLINETTGVVDANALLQDVEADIEQSFRSKVFKAIKSSFNSVKTAVAQRNN